MKIILAITFVYGVLRLLTHTKLFGNHLDGFTYSLLPLEAKKMPKILIWLDVLVFYFSLVYQSLYWIFN